MDDKEHDTGPDDFIKTREKQCSKARMLKRDYGLKYIFGGIIIKVLPVLSVGVRQKRQRLSTSFTPLIGLFKSTEIDTPIVSVA